MFVINAEIPLFVLLEVKLNVIITSFVSRPFSLSLSLCER